MNLLASKLACVLFQIFCFVSHTANIFLADILMYEVTEKVSFDYIRLFKNPLFWIIIILQLLDAFACIVLNNNAHKDDKIVEKAYANGKKDLIGVTVDYVKSGDFYRAEKSIEILDKLEDQQKKEMITWPKKQ